MKLLDWCVAAPTLWRLFDEAAFSLAQDLGEHAVPHVRSLLSDDAPLIERIENRWLAARVRMYVRRFARAEYSEDARKPPMMP